MGRDQQSPLSGRDDVVNWGFIYVAAPSESSLQTVAAGAPEARKGFALSGDLPAQDDSRKPRPVYDDWPVLAARWDLGALAPHAAPTTRYLVLAYDVIQSINFFGDVLPPLWRRAYVSDPLTAPDAALALLVNSTRDYAGLMQRIRTEDAALLADLSAVGGQQYAELSALIFRQAFAACDVVWNQKLNTHWYMLKVRHPVNPSPISTATPFSITFHFFGLLAT
jgi:hypothetical protein